MLATEVQTKHCNKCGNDYPATLDYFRRDKRLKDGLGRWCKTCNSMLMKKWRKESVKYKSILERRVLKRYGITKIQYDDMFTGQNGLCAICRKPESRKIGNIIMSLSVDHCHKTGKVRGLLCDKCNKALGVLEDSISKVIGYIKGENDECI